MKPYIFGFVLFIFLVGSYAPAEKLFVPCTGVTGFGGGGLDKILNIGFNYAYCGTEENPLGIAYVFEVEGIIAKKGDPSSVLIDGYDVRSIDSPGGHQARIVFMKKLNNGEYGIDFFLQFESRQSTTSKIFYSGTALSVEHKDLLFKLRDVPFAERTDKKDMAELLRLVNLLVPGRK